MGDHTTLVPTTLAPTTHLDPVPTTLVPTTHLDHTTLVPTTHQDLVPTTQVPTTHLAPTTLVLTTLVPTTHLALIILDLTTHLVPTTLAPTILAILQVHTILDLITLVYQQESKMLLRWNYFCKRINWHYHQLSHWLLISTKDICIFQSKMSMRSIASTSPIDRES